jgi:hypothetical protein
MSDLVLKPKMETIKLEKPCNWRTALPIPFQFPFNYELCAVLISKKVARPQLATTKI